MVKLNLDLDVGIAPLVKRLYYSYSSYDSSLNKVYGSKVKVERLLVESGIAPENTCSYINTQKRARQSDSIFFNVSMKAHHEPNDTKRKNLLEKFDLTKDIELIAVVETIYSVRFYIRMVRTSGHVVLLRSVMTIPLYAPFYQKTSTSSFVLYRPGTNKPEMFIKNTMGLSVLGCKKPEGKSFKYRNLVREDNSVVNGKYKGYRLEHVW